MAAPPMKSQPLHNFSLPQLRWAHKNPSSPTSSTIHHHHRFRRRNSPDQQQQLPPEDPKLKNPSSDSLREDDNSGEGKPWKLRRRKEIVKTLTTTTSKKHQTSGGGCDAANKGNCSLRSQRLKEMVEGGGQRSGAGAADRKGKRKLWISLSKEEIEEDVYALTGGKPARRPRKWPKSVQKQLDCVFPGLYLVGVAADSYQVMMQ